MKMQQLTTRPRIVRPLLALALLALLSMPASQLARAQASSTTPSCKPAAAEPAKEDKQAAPQQPTIGAELAKETLEADGEEQEEHADLKHAKPVRWLATKINWSVHGTHLLLSGLNFTIVVVVIFWAVRKFVPGILRSRNAAIQQALQEARAASQDANRRLADIENRLRQLDVEIGQMQAAAEKEAEAEEVRIKKAAEEDVRKVVLDAEQEIAAAAKQARRELTIHTAGLAIALARQQINVDSNTDQVLVRTFASGLASHPSSLGSSALGSSSDESSHDEGSDGGKDGR
jgi:F-type H+-transporting ATPase subunit b